MARSANPFTPTTAEEPDTMPTKETPDNVRPMVDPTIERFGGKENRRPDIAPKVFYLGDDDTPFTVYEPDAGTVMDIEEGGSSRRVLALFLGDEWGRAEKLLEGEQPDALVDLAQSLSRHFKLYSGAPEGNRASRRRQARGR